MTDPKNFDLTSVGRRFASLLPAFGYRTAAARAVTSSDAAAAASTPPPSLSSPRRTSASPSRHIATTACRLTQLTRD